MGGIGCHIFDLVLEAVQRTLWGTSEDNTSFGVVAVAAGV
jgi:hypothetical protein